jgi:hypothetical protein
MLAIGCSSTPCSRLSRLRSQSSNFVSSEKSASTAPALVPVTTRGRSDPGDHAKAAVLGISRNLTILAIAQRGCVNRCSKKQVVLSLVAAFRSNKFVRFCINRCTRMQELRRVVVTSLYVSSSDVFLDMDRFPQTHNLGRTNLYQKHVTTTPIRFHSLANFLRD